MIMRQMTTKDSIGFYRYTERFTPLGNRDKDRDPLSSIIVVPVPISVPVYALFSVNEPLVKIFCSESFTGWLVGGRRRQSNVVTTTSEYKK